MLCFGEQLIVGVDRQVASSFAGGASLPVGAFGTDDTESDLSFGADGGGVTGRAGDPVLVVVDNKVVAGELVRTQPRVTTLPDGFDDGPVTSSPQFGADLSRTVGCGGPCYLTGSDDSRVRFCGYVRFVKPVYMSV